MMFGISVPTWAMFTFKGVLGAIVFYCLQIFRRRYKEETPTKSRVLSRLVIGGFAGYFWYGLEMPNLVNPILAGMVAPEFIDFLLERFKKFGENFK